MHAWYGLPIAPVAAALAGRACDVITGSLQTSANNRLLRLSTVGGFFAVLAVLSCRCTAPLYGSWANPYREAALEVRTVALPGAMITFVDTGAPTWIYC